MYRLLRFDILSNVLSHCCCNLAICFNCWAINAVVLRGVCAGSQDLPEPVWWKNSSKGEGKRLFAVEVDRFLDCVYGAVAQALHQHEGRDGVGVEKELTEEGTIAAFSGAAFLSVSFHFKKAQTV